VTEITGMEGDVVTMQDLFILEIVGEDDDENSLLSFAQPVCVLNSG
jgi:hypothetical protein